MANTIILKKSSVSGKVPLSTDLQVAELAVNLADAKLYSKNAAGTVIELAGGGGGGGGSSITIGSTAPSSPSDGDQWLDSLDGILFVRYSGAWAEF